ncbi:phospholipid phosphatase-related protein type 3 isoform X1 [Malaclemys terrapin pileata]|uniref:phospholipid phosphatase-related protein type 3 isoform X1 n=2 Tax=Malaclemys terrapin pileata TaxID=2991368 RepID=UPI0023A7B2E5|nr:phospholipid phosphatase-related protein type 3 isoform X1 [Malaclemys terrapin pileata]XP_053869870.1 phospholipid phosphatase-related protein type 3 isoform X1 [Malaclemys terrapin pileata]XP_053869871.1 phospholipid phosphatase-related protein type 3 isoform X1 [Malaclemys terrapin pileata]
MISTKEKSKAPKDSMTLLPCFYFVELPIVASSIVTLYFLELTDLFKPAKVGFQCYDRALSMPYVETNEEMIPLLMLLSLAFAAPAASIMVGEGIIYCLQSKLKGRSGSEGSINAGGCNFNSFLRRTVRFVGVHVFGLCATALVTDVIQLATGYHAPFFLTVCKPNYTLLGISCDSNPYITQDICSGQDQNAILSARKTFPSQHATLSAFAAVYVSMYFNSIISDSTKLLKPILVFAFAIAAGVCGLTQITQYRSHPIDVYVGFLIGSGIAAYLAYHAVGNFQAPTERAPANPPTKDALRALTQRGHDSVYHQNKSVSTDELNPQTRLDGVNRQVQREKNSLGSLKRASVDVDLLAPRSPMGKENMVTFSNTLPRVNTPSMDDPARRHMTIHVPVDASRSKQLITEWKQKSLEGRSMTLAEEASGHARAGSDSVGADEEEHVPPSLYPTVQARTAERAAMGPRVLIQPRPGASQLVHIPEESQGTANISPNSSSAVRAKWMMMAEKGAGQRVANPPRLMQVIAMSKQQGLVSVTPKHSETSLSSTSSDSSQYRSPSERDSSSIVTIDAHAPHHPVVHLSSGNGPWEWKVAQKGSDGQDAYELNEMGKDYRGFRPTRSAGVSPGSSVSDIEQDEPRYGSVATINVAPGGSGVAERGEGIPENVLGPASRESTLRRKPTGLTVSEKDGHTDNEAENYYKKIQANRRFKE